MVSAVCQPEDASLSAGSRHCEIKLVVPLFRLTNIILAMSSAAQRAKRKEELERAYELQVRAATWVSFSLVPLDYPYSSYS